MRAERERRAVVAESEGDRQAQVRVSEGERQEIVNISEAQKLKQVNEAEGKTKEIELLASATAEEGFGRSPVPLTSLVEWKRTFGLPSNTSPSSVTSQKRPTP